MMISFQPAAKAYFRAGGQHKNLSLPTRDRPKPQHQSLQTKCKAHRNTSTECSILCKSPSSLKYKLLAIAWGGCDLRLGFCLATTMMVIARADARSTTCFLSCGRARLQRPLNAKLVSQSIAVDCSSCTDSRTFDPAKPHRGPRVIRERERGRGRGRGRGRDRDRDRDRDRERDRDEMEIEKNRDRDKDRDRQRDKGGRRVREN